MREKNVIREGGTLTRRVYFHHSDLEEYENGAGMWRTVSGSTRAVFIEASAALMADPSAFKGAMRRALREWPNSCTSAFTTQGSNQRAWLGHAGCYLATGSPEETTRLGWHALDDAEQFAANDAADQIIAEWRGLAAARGMQFDLLDMLAGHDA